MDQDRLNYATVRDLARMLRAGETTPTRLAEHFMGRLKTVGQQLNAVVTITRERALREARLAEEELAAGIDRGPLHGIPYGAKDLLATAGIPTTWGCEPLREQVFDEDATAIRRLREAGAVLVAKLGMVELAGGMGYVHPDAALNGPGVNPWSLDAWAGGSSSGSGSAVGGGAVPFAIGSETWGSILIPASYCGLSGLRPTYGRISRHGAMALCWTLDKLGPICHTADDCGLVLEGMAGRDPADPTTLTASYRYRPELAPTSGFRIGVLRDGLEVVEPEVAANFETACGVLAEFATLEEVSLPGYPYHQVASIILAAEGASAYEDLIDQGLTAGLTSPEDRLGGYAGSVVPAVDYLRALRIRRKLSQALDELMVRYDAIVHPSTPGVANGIDERFGSYAGKRARRLDVNAAGNLAGTPSIGLFNGFGERGLPTAFQVMGRVGAESTVLAIGAAYQARTDWHTRHPER